MSSLVSLESNLVSTEADLHATFDSSVAAALSTWQASEQTAWNAYAIGMADLPGQPELGQRILAPGEVQFSAVAPGAGISIGNRKSASSYFPVSIDSVTQSITQAILSGSVQRMIALTELLRRTGQLSPEGQRRLERAIEAVRIAYYNDRARVIADWFVRGGNQPAFNPRNLDFLRYYQQLAIRIIADYQAQINSGTRTAEQIINHRAAIAVQTGRLNQITFWMQQHGIQPYPASGPLGPDGL